jgi:type I restriction enzyme S subunit
MIFSDFIELHRGYDLPKAKRNADGLVPVIAAGGYDGFHDAAKVQGPGVITGRSGTLGSVYFNTTDFWPLNTTLFVSNFKGNDPLFVYYYLKTMDLGRYATGTTVPTLNRNHLDQIKVNIPDLAQQREIANKLNLFDEKISMLNDINDNLLELAQQIFVGKYLIKQDSFPMTTLSEIVGVKTDTFNPKKSNDNEVAHFSLPAFDSGSVPTVDLVDSIKSNKNIITQYTVLASKMNPTTKRVWIPNYVQGMTNVASTEFLTFNASDEYQQAFIWAVVDSEGYQNHLISGATGSTGSRQRIKPGDAYSFEVGYDPDEAHRIGMILNPLLQKVKNNRDEIVTLVQLRDNLLAHLLN